jgi:hypothetical protein
MLICIYAYIYAYMFLSVSAYVSNLTPSRSFQCNNACMHVCMHATTHVCMAYGIWHGCMDAWMHGPIDALICFPLVWFIVHYIGFISYITYVCMSDTWFISVSSVHIIDTTYDIGPAVCHLSSVIWHMAYENCLDFWRMSQLETNDD